MRVADLGHFDRQGLQQQQQQDWRTLEFVSQEMKGDRDWCLAAVAQNGRALQWASEEMKGDRELCIAALAQIRDGPFLHWGDGLTNVIKAISDEMKRDEEVLAAAIGCQLKHMPHAKGNLNKLKQIALMHAPEQMFQNRCVRNAAGI